MGRNKRSRLPLGVVVGENVCHKPKLHASTASTGIPTPPQPLHPQPEPPLATKPQGETIVLAEEPAKARNQGASVTMEQFSKHFDTLQAAILSTEVDDNVGQICQCHHEAALYRCMDCLFPVSCGRCIVASHATNPFHHIQKWNGFFFGKTTLSELGQVVGLGHDGGLCPNRLLESKGRVTTVVHVNGIHQVRIEFCHCHKAPAEPEQLAKASLFPATVDRPATAFTFEVLKQFDILSLTFKIPAYDFVNALVNMTNSAFPDKVPDRYREFLRVVRVWRHLATLRQSGQTDRMDDVIDHRRSEPGFNVNPDVQNASDDETDELETVKLKRGLEAIFEPADSIPRKEMPLEGAIDGNRTYVTVEKEFGQVRRKLG